MIFPLQWVPVMIPMTPMIRMISCLEFFFSSGWMGCVGSGKIDVHLWFWIWGGCFRLHLGQRDKKKLIASDQAAIFEGKCWVSLAGYPSSCSPNITPFCPIQPLYNPYIGGILLVYMSRTLPGVPNFSIWNFRDLFMWKVSMNMSKPIFQWLWWCVFDPQNLPGNTAGLELLGGPG